jgi:hypothetical protein
MTTEAACERQTASPASGPSARPGNAAARAILAIPRLGGRLLDRIELVMDRSSTATSRPAIHLRRAFAAAAAALAIALSVKAFMDGAAPGPAHLILFGIALVLFTNRFGAFLRDWCPVLILFGAYAVAFGLVQSLSLHVWYSPQIHADEVIGLGELPTTRLQGWFDAAGNRPLAVISALGYLSHFIVPPIFGFFLWWTRRGRGFREYMYSLIAVNLLASVVWILAPTAPPWLAAKQGLIVPPIDVLRMGLQDLGFTQLVAFKDSNTYLIAAALPSIHASWPLLGMLVVRKHRLPAAIGAMLAAQLMIVWFVIVYSGEHYVIDIVFGVAFSLAAWRLVQQFAGSGATPQPDAYDPRRDVPVEREPLTAALR